MLDVISFISENGTLSSWIVVAETVLVLLCLVLIARGIKKN